MKGFCEDKDTCRHVQLLQYFGEQLSSGPCKDRCDNCRRRAGQKHDPDWPEQVHGVSTRSYLCNGGAHKNHLLDNTMEKDLPTDHVLLAFVMSLLLEALCNHMMVKKAG